MFDNLPDQLSGCETDADADPDGESQVARRAAHATGADLRRVLRTAPAYLHNPA
jgi:hypothetical protein